MNLEGITQMGTIEVPELSLRITLPPYNMYARHEGIEEGLELIDTYLERKMGGFIITTPEVPSQLFLTIPIMNKSEMVGHMYYTAFDTTVEEDVLIANIGNVHGTLLDVLQMRSALAEESPVLQEQLSFLSQEQFQDVCSLVALRYAGFTELDRYTTEPNLISLSKLLV